MEDIRYVLCIIGLITVLMLTACFAAVAGQDNKAPLLPAPLTWAMSIEALDERLAQHEELTLIDLRPQQQAARVVIPDALNIPAFALKRKAFLRGKPLLLIDEGYAAEALHQLCEELRQAGFEVWYLYGGLNAWHAAGKPLRGDVFAQRDLDRLPPQALERIVSREHWLPIALSETKDLTGFQNLSGLAVSCPFTAQPDEFQTCVATAIESRVYEPFLSILLLNQRGTHDDEMIRLLQPLTKGIPVWSLRGGLQAYRDYLAQQQQISQGKGQNTTSCTRPADCRPCAR